MHDENMKLILTDINRFLSFCLRFQISLPYKRMARANLLRAFILENFWTIGGLKLLFLIPSMPLI